MSPAGATDGPTSSTVMRTGSASSQSAPICTSAKAADAGVEVAGSGLTPGVTQGSTVDNHLPAHRSSRKKAQKAQDRIRPVFSVQCSVEDPHPLIPSSLRKAGRASIALNSARTKRFFGLR